MNRLKPPLITTYNKKEYMAFLRKELLEYEASFDNLSEQERKELHDWVRDGNRVFDNPYSICEEDGWPMDFISAMRIEGEMIEYFERFGFPYDGEENPAGVHDGDLPF